MDPDIKQKASLWLKEPYGKETREQVKHLIENDPKELSDSFYTSISFGTGGMRGLMGVGPNRLNLYTIRNATQGLANYILKEKKEPSVFISYDSRKNSHLFAKETARVLAGNQIKVFITKELRPTPFVSFGCRLHGCQAAVMITASHNPPEYNGYKVYWEDGAQIVSPHDTGIINEVKKITHPDQVKVAPFDHPLIYQVGQEDDTAYLHTLTPLANFPEHNKTFGKTLSIIYSNLHGAGITTLPQALKNWGFSSLTFVEKQKAFDPNFSYAHSPNPEDPKALELGIETLLQKKGDIFFVTDPDADRIGVVIVHQDKPFILNGNQIAALCVYYLCSTLKMPDNSAFVTTIVTTKLFETILKSFNRPCFEVLTGFKYIGEKIHQWDQNKEHSFIFGAEESLGYLYGTHSRDKDATIAACLLAEMALQMKKDNKTLVNLLYEIYHKFGLFKESQLSMQFGTGKVADQLMTQAMKRLRKNPFKEIDGQEVSYFEDYQEGKNLPPSNVLAFHLKDGSRFIIRPSGTEPKIKIYGMVRLKKFPSIEEGLKMCDHTLNIRLKEISTFLS